MKKARAEHKRREAELDAFLQKAFKQKQKEPNSNKDSKQQPHRQQSFSTPYGEINAEVPEWMSPSAAVRPSVRLSCARVRTRMSVW